MRKVYLEGVLGEKYGAEWNLAVNSPAEALTAIMAQRPGMRQFIIDGENVQGYEILIGEDSIQTPEELVINDPGMKNAYTFVPVIAGSKSTALMMVVGVALVAMTGGFGAAFVPGFMGTAAVAAVPAVAATATTAAVAGTAGVAATTGTGVPAAFDVNITSVDANGSITGIAINTASTAGVDGSIAAITGGNNDAYVTIRTTFPGSNQRGCCLYVGGAGDVNVTLESGNTVIFAGVNAGSFLPICATQVLSASTTATNMLALY